MAYRFAADGHGEVIAEACAAGLEPYLGLRYPASDIPAQARRQYLRQKVGAIADSSYRPVPLLTDAMLDDGAPLDLSRSALSAGDQFSLLYQPLFSVSNGGKSLAGFEALIRWRHLRHGWMPPGRFVPLAEQSGLILPLGDWALASAVRQANVFRRLGRQPGFCSGLAGALEAEGLDPGTLTLEVTETMLTDAASLTVLQDIRGIGVRVAIDDFGIGYSSLSYLRRLPADVVKLDRSFLEGIDTEDDGARFVGAVIALAHVAGKTVVFEGIETHGQFDLAIAADANMVQGFFLVPPLSTNAAEDLVRQPRDRSQRSPRAPFTGSPHDLSKTAR
jgi:EAL domain-containing protein (putative c-di-GMP-specific phosphodiesterase class I)